MRLGVGDPRARSIARLAPGSRRPFFTIGKAIRSTRAKRDEEEVVEVEEEEAEAEEEDRCKLKW